MPTQSNLPPELLAQLNKPRDTIKRDAHSLTLVYCEANGPSTVDELLVYIWKVTGEVKSRDYMYQILKRLRDRGLLERVELDGEVAVRHMLTPGGERHMVDTGLEYIVPGRSAADETEHEEYDEDE